MRKRQVRFPIIPWAETVQIHHCRSQGEGALDAVYLHVVSLSSAVNSTVDNTLKPFLHWGLKFKFL